ncbi:MAG: hypothetical protein M3410_04490 [Acidobacteriota bacterium]|nr:hypothetical protein [Acidobacteriota bacterium]
MRKTMLKTMSGVALAILLALTISQIPVSGQDARAHQPQDAEKTQSQESSERSARARRLEGTWLLQFTGRNCQTGDPIPSRSVQLLITYVRGGTLLETSSAVSGAVRSTGQGVWHDKGGRNYAATFMFFRFNPDGSFAGTTRVTQDINLSRGGDELNVTNTLEVLDANGTVIFTVCGTATGTRLE